MTAYTLIGIAVLVLKSFTSDINASTLPDGTYLTSRLPLDTHMSHARLNQGMTGQWGRSVTIAICGIDSRLGVEQAHADANHVLRIWLDRGKIDIISIPRGTHVDAGFSTPSLNILANYRARKGKSLYLRKLAELAGVGKIDYYVELGFSQAIGVFELLGFKGSAITTLRVLRSRKAFSLGDHQRCYNQAQFIRHTILKHFPRKDHLLDALTLHAALALIETNLRYDIVRSLLETLRATGFPRDENDVSIILHSKRARVKVFDVSNESAITQLDRHVDRTLRKHNLPPAKTKFTVSAYQLRLHSLLCTAARALDQKQPWRAIKLLQRPYQQRAWYQIPDERSRNYVMQMMCLSLIEAYQATGNILKADEVVVFMAQMGVPSHVNVGSSSISLPSDPAH